MTTALVLSGGGMFGAWQAGAWSSLCEAVQPDLVVGASIGSLNGYLIASGISPEDLARHWMDSKTADLSHLEANIRRMMHQYHPAIPFAVAITDLLRLKPRVVTGAEVTWRHLAASCAVPFLLPQQRIDGRWYTDGGLLNPLPLWAAIEMGATRAIALHVLPDVPSTLLRPFVKAFRFLAGYHPPVPPGVTVEMFMPGERLGGIRDALYWKRSNIERWLALGAADARRIKTSIAS